MRRAFGRSPLGLWLHPWIELVRRVLAPRGVRRALDGETFRVDARVRYLWNAEREPGLRAFLRRHVGDREVVLDVGSHAGIYALLFSRLSPRGSIHAFEPNPATRAVLERHVRLNGVADRVFVNGVAASDRIGEAEFFALPLEGMSRLGSANELLRGKANRLVVKTVTLDSYCEARGITPTWLRLDVEGFEFAVLRGASKLIASGRPRLFIVAEMHPGAWADAGDTEATALSLLDELGLDPIPLTGQQHPLREYGIVHLAYRSRTW